MKRKINTDGFDSFFSYVSKAVIIIPIFVLIISLFLKFNSPKNSSLSLNLVTPTTIQITQNNSFKFNLNGPYHCIYKNNTQNFEAFIKNKNILLKVTQNNSEKKYLLTSYAPMIENFLKQDLSGLQLMASKYNINLKEALNSCRKEDVKDSIFK